MRHPVFEKEKILSTFDLFISILTQETEAKEELTKEKLKAAIEHLHKMTEMLPKSFREIHTGLIKQPIIQDKNSMRHWLNEQFQIIDLATYQIQHPEPLDNFVAKMMNLAPKDEIMLPDALPDFLRSIGLTVIARSKFILAHKYAGLHILAKHTNFQEVINMSMLLQGLNSYEAHAQKFYGRIKYCNALGVFTCLILTSIVTILVNIVVILTSFEPILEKCDHNT